MVYLSRYPERVSSIAPWIVVQFAAPGVGLTVMCAPGNGCWPRRVALHHCGQGQLLVGALSLDDASASAASDESKNHTAVIALLGRCERPAATPSPPPVPRPRAAIAKHKAFSTKRLPLT